MAPLIFKVFSPIQYGRYGLGRLYTRSGDNGYTYGKPGLRVPKSHPLIEFYGSLDEANSMIGLARSLLRSVTPSYEDDLRWVQKLIFRIGFSVTSGNLKVTDEDVRKLEEITDKYYDKPLEKFILPGGPPGVAALHIARTVVRRAERRLVALKLEGENIDDILVRALNRLGDALFAMALNASRKTGYEPEPASE